MNQEEHQAVLYAIAVLQSTEDGRNTQVPARVARERLVACLDSEAKQMNAQRKSSNTQEHGGLL